jgi:hypothetical protein
LLSEGVQELPLDPDRTEYAYVLGTQPVYHSVNGPDADGDVDLSIKVPLPPNYPPRVVVHASNAEDSKPGECAKQVGRSGWSSFT